MINIGGTKEEVFNLDGAFVLEQMIEHDSIISIIDFAYISHIEFIPEFQYQPIKII